jgi:hypothetical protein
VVGAVLPAGGEAACGEHPIEAMQAHATSVLATIVQSSDRICALTVTWPIRTSRLQRAANLRVNVSSTWERQTARHVFDPTRRHSAALLVLRPQLRVLGG